jgi:DNA repair exonuclease SbcCD ATPase subunit
MNLQEIRNKLERKRGQADQIKLDLDKAISNCENIKKEISYSEKSQAIIQAVAKATQEELEYRITEPVSLALAAVYNDPYKMVARFEITGRGNTECHLGFERNGNIIKPLEASGGGPIDIASFALRIGSWSLAQPRSRPILICDEPFKWIDKKKIPGTELTTMHLAGQFLREVSKPPPEGLGLQIIMISHITELISSADRIFETSIKNQITSVEVR